jgi:hypothetical protein
MPSLIRTYSGRCELIFGTGVVLNADYRLQFSSDGRIDVTAELPYTEETESVVKARLGGNLIECSFKGRAENASLGITKLVLANTGMRVDSSGSHWVFELTSATPVEIDHAPFDPNKSIEVHYGLTNFIFNGCEYSTYGNVSRLDRFGATLDGFALIFRQIQQDKVFVEKLAASHDTEVTAEVVAKLPFESMRLVDELVEDALMLLSFATGTYIATIYSDIFVENTLVRSILCPYKTGPYVHRDWVIDADNLRNCDLRDFLETCYPMFRKYKSELGLKIVLEFLVIAKQGRYSEVKFLLGSVAAECLLSHLPSYFRTIGKTATGNSFRSKMRELLDHFNVTHDESELDFIDTRDTLVHTGRFPKGVSPHEETMKFGNLLDRTVLTILGYKGKAYLNRANRYSSEYLS